MAASNLRLNLSTIPHFRVIFALALRRLELILHLVRLDGILLASVEIDFVECRLGLILMMLVWLYANDFTLSSVDFLARG